MVPYIVVTLEVSYVPIGLLKAMALLKMFGIAVEVSDAPMSPLSDL
jgi:hypothetical protein